jgi:hypothetical protein
MRVARQVLAARNHPIDAQALVRMVTRDAAAIAGLGDKLGLLAKDRPADLVVFERHLDDPWENVCEADPSWVDLVMIDGDLAYGRADWMKSLVADDHIGRLEQLFAWGKPMLLDTSYALHPGPQAAPTLAQLRADLISKYPQVGPIFA